MRYFLNVLFILAWSPLATAAPLHYQFNFRVPYEPFKAASLQLDVTWDASEYPPFANSHYAIWPVGNAKARLTVIGSAGEDGAYDASFPFPDVGFSIQADDGVYSDAMTFPFMDFESKGRPLARIKDLTVMFRGRSFYTTSTMFFPRPYADADTYTSHRPLLLWRNYTFLPQVISRTATFVPEPSALALGGLALLSLAALRRRK